MRLYRKNEGLNPILLIGGLGALAFIVYEWIQSQTAAIPVVMPVTSNTTLAAQTSGTNPNAKYALSSNDVTAIYQIGVTQLSVVNGLAAWPTWSQAYTLYRGFPPPQVGVDNTTPITVSEAANYINNWVNNQALVGFAGLGVIGRNYGPPAYTQPGVGRYELINASGRQNGY